MQPYYVNVLIVYVLLQIKQILDFKPFNFAKKKFQQLLIVLVKAICEIYQVYINPDTTIPNLKYVTTQIQLSLYSPLCINPDTTLSVFKTR